MRSHFRIPRDTVADDGPLPEKREIRSSSLLRRYGHQRHRGLIWAAAAIAFTGGYSQLQDALGSGSPAILVNDISKGWLGAFGGILAILG